MAPDSHLSFWNKYVQPPLDLMMKNPVVTPPILLILAVASFFITAVMLVLVLSLAIGLGL